MRTYLLDSHTFLWALLDIQKLSKKVKSILEDPDNEIFVSSVTFWEISLKYGLGKLDLNGVDPEELPELALQTGFELMPLLPHEAAAYHKLDATWHRDPFDRMLIRQAIQKDITLISKDKNVAQYSSAGLKILW